VSLKHSLYPHHIHSSLDFRQRGPSQENRIKQTNRYTSR